MRYIIKYDNKCDNKCDNKFDNKRWYIINMIINDNKCAIVGP
jgi:hypothetical protein